MARLSRPANFDRVAHLYRWAEYAALGRLLERVRTVWLGRLGRQGEALVLGDGDGRFTAAMLAAHPAMSATAVDSSATMLALLRRRCAAVAAERLNTVQAYLPEALTDGNTALPNKPDLIVSHFLLDCFDQAGVEAIVRAVAARCAPGAVWLVSDFGEPASAGWKLLGRIYVRALYAAFGMLTGLEARRLPSVAAALSVGGFTRTDRREWLNGLLYSELWVRGGNTPASDATPLPPLPSTTV